MTAIYAHFKTILFPIIFAVFILTSAPVFVVVEQSFSRSAPAVAEDAAPEALLSDRTTIIYKS